MERRLAAILVADMVGYSRLVEADEAGTLAALKKRHDHSRLSPAGGLGCRAAKPPECRQESELWPNAR